MQHRNHGSIVIGLGAGLAMGIGLSLGVGAIGTAHAPMSAQAGAITQPAEDRAAPPPAPAPPPNMGEMLAEGIRSVEGALGAELGQFESGKLAIVGWFEDKAAAVRWYNHPMHRMLMRGAGGAGGPPLAHVGDDEGPIMVIATITMAEKPEQRLPNIPIPVSQIAIEMFKPLPGGAFINSRFSPKEFKVEHMRDFTDAVTGQTPADSR